MLAIFGAVVITVGTIGGVAFASNVKNNSFKEDQQTTVKENSIKTNQISVQNNDTKIKDTINDSNNSDNTNYNINSANNPSKDIYQEMVKIMRDNGFKDAARYMQTGNYAAMRDYMKNLSQEDYDKMVEIMNNNGFGYMGQMMESIGRAGMVQMHNSMGTTQGTNTNRYNMMGQYK
jgi:hypothetical protein